MSLAGIQGLHAWIPDYDLGNDDLSAVLSTFETACSVTAYLLASENGGDGGTALRSVCRSFVRAKRATPQA